MGCLDLFCGAGGFTLGLEAAGFQCLGGMEIDEVAARTFADNFGERPASFLGPGRGDIRKLSSSRVADALTSIGVRDLDLLVAAPPCQGFSRIGRGKLDSMASGGLKFSDDARNHLYKHAIRFLRTLRPRAFLFENVVGIMHVGGWNAADSVCRAVARAGYVVRAAVLNSAWYGVPQTRERLFILALREDLGRVPTFPPREFSVNLTRGHLSQARLDPRAWSDADFLVPYQELPVARKLRRAVSAHDALGDLPLFKEHLAALRNGHKYRPRRELVPPASYRREPHSEFAQQMRNWGPFESNGHVADQFCRWTPRDFETFARMRPGDRYGEALAIARARYAERRAQYEAGLAPRPKKADFIPPYPDGTFDEKWWKLDPRAPSRTITAHLSKDTYSHIHYDSRQARSITAREAARLQSFPDAFRFAGNMGDMFEQIGNAVPPLLAKAVASEVHRTLGGEKS